MNITTDDVKYDVHAGKTDLAFEKRKKIESYGKANTYVKRNCSVLLSWFCFVNI